MYTRNFATISAYHIAFQPMKMDTEDYRYNNINKSHHGNLKMQDETGNQEPNFYHTVESLEEGKLIVQDGNNVENDENIINIEKEPRKKIIKILDTLDILFSIFIVTPLVVACWRGLWQLMDVYMCYFPAWESFLIAVGTHIILALGQETFHSLLVETKKHFGHQVVSWFFRKFYTFIFNVISNMHWRGCWILMDYYFGLEMTPDGRVRNEGRSNAYLFTLICFLILGVMKCLRNLGGPPFSVVSDKGEEMFLFPTMFKQDIKEKIHLYILDCLFSVAVVATLGILVWRGIWALMDIFLFPENEVKSSWGSFIIGYIVVGFVFLLQPLMKSLCENLDGKLKLIASDFFITLSVIGTIALWRGIWNLLNVYFLPDHNELSCWITFLLPFFILAFLDCSNSLLARGVYIDAEEPGGDCVIFPCYYLRQMFLEEKVEQKKCCDADTDSLGEEMKREFSVTNHVITISSEREKMNGKCEGII